jgi:hypothetical protein
MGRRARRWARACAQRLADGRASPSQPGVVGFGWAGLLVFVKPRSDVIEYEVEALAATILLRSASMSM